MKTTIESGMFIELCARFFDTEYNLTLANICRTTLDSITDDLAEQFNYEFTEDEIKQIWKAWFSNAISNGTLISSKLVIPGKENWEHLECSIHDFMLSTCCKAIDNL